MEPFERMENFERLKNEDLIPLFCFPKLNRSEAKLESAGTTTDTITAPVIELLFVE